MTCKEQLDDIEEILADHFVPCPEPSPLESTDVLVDFDGDGHIPPVDYAALIAAYYEEGDSEEDDTSDPYDM